MTQEYDSYGHVIAARDSATKLAYWKLTGVDDAGRFQQEAFGNDVVPVGGTPALPGTMICRRFPKHERLVTIFRGAVLS